MLFCAVAGAVACGLSGATQGPSAVPTVAPTPRPPDMPVATPTPVTAVPLAILEAVTAEAARLSGVPAEQIAIVRADAAVWPDGSLGCPQPDEMYTQALVNGYWVVLQAGGQEYDFRVGNNGILKLCATDSGG